MSSSIFSMPFNPLQTPTASKTPNMIQQTAPVQQTKIPQTSGDIITVITDYLKKNDGNTEQAFYAIAKDYNIDPTPLVNEIKAMRDPQGFAQDLIKNNPQINQLLTLLSNVK